MCTRGPPSSVGSSEHRRRQWPAKDWSAAETPRAKVDRVAAVCEACGVVFHPRRRDARFCSRRCQSHHWRAAVRRCATCHRHLPAGPTDRRRPVAGFDCTFTAPKSVSVLWALANDSTREAIYDCHRRAITDVLTLIERDVARTRIGTNGTAQVDVASVPRRRTSVPLTARQPECARGLQNRWSWIHPLSLVRQFPIGLPLTVREAGSYAEDLGSCH